MTHISLTLPVSGKAALTIITILKNKENIKALKASKDITLISTKTKKRPEMNYMVGNILLVCINEKQLSGNSVSETTICEKGKVL